MPSGRKEKKKTHIVHNGLYHWLKMIVGFMGDGLDQSQQSPMGLIKEPVTSHHHFLLLISFLILQYFTGLKLTVSLKVRFFLLFCSVCAKTEPKDFSNIILLYCCVIVLFLAQYFSPNTCFHCSTAYKG